MADDRGEVVVLAAGGATVLMAPQVSLRPDGGGRLAVGTAELSYLAGWSRT